MSNANCCAVCFDPFPLLPDGGRHLVWRRIGTAPAGIGGAMRTVCDSCWQRGQTR